MSCDSCLEFFKTSTIGQCESTKKPEHPKYKIVGFARYHRIGKRIIFRMYLRVIFSMMYGSKLEFTLTATEKTTLFEEKVKSICNQTGTATGSISSKPSVLDSTAIFDCEAILNKINFSLMKLTIDDVKIKEINGQKILTKM